MIDKKTLARYAELKVSISEMNDELDLLKDEIVAGMKEVGADKLDADYGTFSLASKKTWKYSPAVESLNEQLDTTKKQEQADGTAECEENKYLVFKAKKDTE